jgi:hypothetical protein
MHLQFRHDLDRDLEHRRLDVADHRVRHLLERCLVNDMDLMK